MVGKPVDKGQLGRMNKFCRVHNSEMGFRLGKKKVDASGSGSCPVADCTTNVAHICLSNTTQLSIVAKKRSFYITRQLAIV